MSIDNTTFWAYCAFEDHKTVIETLRKFVQIPFHMCAFLLNFYMEVLSCSKE
jgi:hypothetical protein